MIRELRGNSGCSKALRRLYHEANSTAAAAAAATVVPTDTEAESPQPTTQLPRLWAMQRLSTSKKQLVAAAKAWRIPGAFNKPLDWLPPGLGRLLYLDRLQVNKFYWQFGYPGFICERFHLDVYDPSWERNHNAARVIGSVEVYAHMLNRTEENDITNLILVRTKDWGLRCSIHYSGEQDCIGVKKGGILKKDLIFLAFECDLNVLVPKISLDVTKLDIGEQIRISDLDLNLQLRSNLELSTVICEVLPESAAGNSCEVLLPESAAAGILSEVQPEECAAPEEVQETP